MQIRVDPAPTPQPEERLLVRSAAQFELYYPAVGHFSATDGDTVRFAPEQGADPRDVEAILLGIVWAALCYQRDLLLLHASVVGVGAAAVAFCGAQQAGKSSVAAYLAQQGYPLLSDDLSRCTVLPGAGAQVWPGGGRLKLWPDALAALQWRGDEGQLSNSRQEKYQLSLPDHKSLPDTMALRSIFLLEWGELRMRRLNGLTALGRFVDAANYGGHTLLGPMGKLAAHWQRCIELLRHVEIWEFSRPKNWAALPAAMALLEEHLHQLGS